ncbi:MAG: hypothetical protein JWN04_3825 [Myxococcaceae bacterium]|nr:hypothetical protein [Myxococcaceae bacterium]
MKCLVCHATSASGTVCPQCGFDQSAAGAADQARILSAREAFKDKTTAFAPDSRVTRKDKLVPWLALGVGLLLFVFWVKVCSPY